MKPEERREKVSELAYLMEEEIVLADGLDSALLGVDRGVRGPERPISV